MNPSNPYAPPETRGEAPPRQGDWYTEGTTLFVADGAVLPAIDLETGETFGNLIEVNRKFAVAGATFGLWGIVPSLFKLIPKEWKREFRPGSNDFWILIAAALVLIAVHIFVIFRRPSLLGKCVRFTTHRNAEQERKRKRSKILLIIWFCLSLLGPVGVLLFIILDIRPITASLPSIITVMAISVASMLAAAIWQWFHQPQIRLKGFSDKWLRVHGACDKALAHLRKIDSERSLHPAE